MLDWMRKFFSDDNTVNENTVLGIMSFMMAFGFACFKVEVPMWAFLGYSATCFGLNLKRL